MVRHTVKLIARIDLTKPIPVMCSDLLSLYRRETLRRIDPSRVRAPKA